MKNIKLILIGIAVLFFATAIVTVNIQAKKIKERDKEIARIQLNNIQLMAENKQKTTLVLKERELTGKVLAERDSLAERLKIRPKEILKVITETIIQTDTVIKKVPVYIAEQNFWKIKDAGPCFKWQADAFLKDDSLSVNRTLFSYSNKTTDVYFKERPRKFLFIRYGKWQYKQKIDSECGGISTREIQFIK